MTTPNSNSPPGSVENIDTGPLSWVMVEIRESLNRSRAALQEALTQDAETQPTTLRHAKSFLHQAHGALQIVDVDGVAIITETVEDLFDRIEAGHLAFTAAVAEAVSNAYQALLEYLEELLSGVPHQPVRLFPYYRTLLEARGAERIHPADLFFPNLSIRPQLPPLPDHAGAPAADYAGLRKRFERALLPFIKATDAAAVMSSAAVMRDLIAEVERAQGNQQSRVFWWVLHGFAEAVAAGQVKNELYVKQLFARINLQIRRLSEGSGSIAERLLRDALFFVARAENPTPLVQQIRRAYQLDGAVPVDYEKKRYGQIDTEALAVAKDRLSHAKNAWNRIAGGDGSVISVFESELGTLIDAGSKLNSPPLLKLLRELGGIARHSLHGRAAEALALEMATALLFVENALNHISHLPDNFSERADAMTARLLSVVSGEQPTETAEWLDDMSREAQQRQTMQVLTGELQTSLRQVEKSLDEFFNDPAQRGGLAQIETTLHQIGGALAILDQEDAVAAIKHTQEAVRRFAEADPEAAPDVAQFQHVARNVGALSFFIETLQLNSEGVKKRFSFDQDTGVFHANLLEKNSAARIDVEVEGESVSAPAVEQADSTIPHAAVSELPTVEDELLKHQQHTAELAKSLTAEPHNPELQEQLKESLEQVRRDATLVDNPEATASAQTAIKMLKELEASDAAPTQEALAEIISAAAPAVPEPAPLPMPAPVLAAPETDEEVDAELLEIFLFEAEEVLQCVHETIPQSRSEPYNQDHLTTLRRSFHTLKGSGRMVGLMAFGEGAWSIEQVLNLRLSETRAGDADLYALLDTAADFLGGWVKDLHTTGKSARTPHALVKAAEGVKAGLPFVYEAEAAVAVPESVTEVVAANEVAVDAAPVHHEAAPAHQEAAPHHEPVAETAAPEAPLPEVEPEPAALEPLTEELMPPIALSEEIHLADAPVEAHDAVHVEIPAETHEAAHEGGHEAMHDAAYAEAHEPAPEHVGHAEQVEARHAEPVHEEPAAPVADVIEFPGMSKAVSQDDTIKRIGDVEISVPLYNIYLAETDELVRVLSQDIGEWRHESERHVNVHVVHAAHSLAGSSATVGFTPLQEVAHALEMVLQFLARKPVRLIESDYDTLDHSIERIRFMLQMFALGEMPDHEPEQVQILERMQGEIEARLHLAPELQPQHTPHVTAPAIESRSEPEQIEPIAEPVIEPAIEPVPDLSPPVVTFLEPAFEQPAEPVVEQHVVEPAFEPAPEPVSESFGLPEIPVEPAAETIELTVPDLPQADGDNHLEAPQEMSEQALPAFERRAEPTAEAVAAPAPGELSHAEDVAVPEPAADTVAFEPSHHEPEPPRQPVVEHTPEPAAEVAHVAQVIDVPAVEVPSAPQADAAPAFSREEIAAVDPALLSLPKDELDADLLPVFLEEGRDMFPQLGENLRAWQSNPANSAAAMQVLRLLHTLKGSARMAGAMGLGQHMHDMETRIEIMTHSGAPNPAGLDEMLTRFDQGSMMFEELQNPELARRNAQLRAAAAAAAAQPLAAVAVEIAAEQVSQPATPAEVPSLVPLQSGNVVVPKFAPANAPVAKPAAQAAPVPLVRVRADILDRLVNQAGEVSISRSRIETEVGTLRQSLTEMTENVARLRDQLREIEMQAESQISSRMAHSGDREFDPLEFDRFTRLQELTRMMAESVNDVGSVQQNLARTVENATMDLTTQSRLTRDLQQDLMRVRMIQFASISERLYRVVRQASKELDKRVNLDIRGSAVEIDRGVLEKMTGPFEHLLRNAIVHGIETRDKRVAAGKSEIGELLVEIRQEGNEVVIQFSDDGAGLNLERIRSKALALGLIKEDEEQTEAEVTDLIFHSGFSTADNVTELAGRGVGMDVVRSEAAGLGGRVGVVSEAGKGAHFTIHLPLTLAVTQVVLLTTGGKTYAVPSVLVEQVQQLKTNPLTAAYNEGAVLWQGQRVPLHYLSTLLGDRDATPVAQQYSPIVILKSGSDRVALHVDEIIGNREVVVKNIGPQLARMIGIAGATVLGSGDIVLILNPVPLAQRFAHENVRAPRLTQVDTPDNMGAVADLAQAPAEPAKAEPVQGLRTQHIVMVVDDSLTVRRVTQRLLAREGYQVVLAKDGVDALEQLQSINPDVMLVDIEMPRMDGFDLTRNVRSDDRTKHIPIIMITSRTATKHRNYAMELGVNEYLGKPYQEDALLKSIAGFVNKETPVV
ncbi:MAG TPA: Hpt domain-containing protein [Burkholderiaceae bacterium]